MKNCKYHIMQNTKAVFIFLALLIAMGLLFAGATMAEQGLEPSESEEEMRLSHITVDGTEFDIADKALDLLETSAYKELDGKDCYNTNMVFEQGIFTQSNPSVESDKGVRSEYFRGGVYLVNEDQNHNWLIYIYSEDKSDLIDPDNVSNSRVDGSVSGYAGGYFRDSLLYLPRLKVGWYRICVKYSLNNSDLEFHSPVTNKLRVYIPAEDDGFYRGAFNSGGYVYNANSVITDLLEIGEANEIAVRLNNSGYRYAISYTVNNGASFTSVFSGYTQDKEYHLYDKTVKYCIRIATVTGTTFNYNNAINAVKITFPQKVYGYHRVYSDISYRLQWLHKDIDAVNGIVDSDYVLMAELPKIGNVEIKMNMASIAFSVWKKDYHGEFSKLQDWTHYFYRYTSNDRDGTQYFVLLKKQSGEATDTFTYGMRGLKVYTYEDEGCMVNIPSPYYGKSIAVFGDSIVQGRFRKLPGTETNTVASKPWGNIISEHCDTDPANYGIGGAPVYGDEWLTLYTNRNVVTGYDIVFVCAGTNDFGADVTEANFKSAYSDVLTALKANNTKVIAVTPTTRRTNSVNDIEKYLSDYVGWIKEVATTADVPVIDLYELTKNDEVFKGTLADGLHPNETGHRIIAELIMRNAPE